MQPAEAAAGQKEQLFSYGPLCKVSPEFAPRIRYYFLPLYYLAQRGVPRIPPNSPNSNSSFLPVSQDFHLAAVFQIARSDGDFHSGMLLSAPQGET